MNNEEMIAKITEQFNIEFDKLGMMPVDQKIKIANQIAIKVILQNLNN